MLDPCWGSEDYMGFDSEIQGQDQDWPQLKYQISGMLTQDIIGFHAVIYNFLYKLAKNKLTFESVTAPK